MRYLVYESEMEWQEHPEFEGVLVKVLQSRRDHGSMATVVMTRVPKGGEVPVHVHEGSDDILYIIDGMAEMAIDGIGNFEMQKGGCLRVPKDTKHRIFNVTKDLLLYDVWAPPTI